MEQPMKNKKNKLLAILGALVLCLFVVVSVQAAISKVYLPLVQRGTSITTTGAVTQSGGIASQTNLNISASGTDESGVTVSDGGVYTLTHSTVTTSGNTSSGDNSSFYGLNAGVLAKSAATIYLSKSIVTTTGTGANGVFATGSGSSVTLDQVTIDASGALAHGVMATNGGVLSLTDVNITTLSSNAAALATDRGGGTIQASGGVMTTAGNDSPGIYSTGVISVSQAEISASGSEAAVIEGSNSIVLNNTNLSGAKKWGVMIYQSMSGDAQGAQGEFTMIGGSLAAQTGPLFYVTNSTGYIYLAGINLNAASGTLVSAGAGNWGTSGSNGGTVYLTANAQPMAGDILIDSLSYFSGDLQNGSLLQGAINTANTAKSASLTLDAASSWQVSADSYLTCLTDPGGINGSSITNITGNGHTVYYQASACSALGGKTYTLGGGGELKPVG
jgi:hypothetical protein